MKRISSSDNQTTDLKKLRFLEIRQEAELASGPLPSLRTRASGYLDLYQSSNGACLFALVAAHGALWASWYLVCAKLAAILFAGLDFTSRLSPVTKYSQFSAYVTTLKEINKLVMVETYVLVHTIEEFGPEFAADMGLPADLTHDYDVAMRESDVSSEFLRDLYHRHFLWEQDRVVSSKLDDAFAIFTWPLMKNLCQRPWVWFSYFDTGKSMNFKSFTDQTERVEKGMLAYDRAIAFGVDRLSSFTGARLRMFPGTYIWLSRFKTGSK